MTRIAGRALSVALSIALWLGALELGLRVFWKKQLLLGAGIEDPHFHHRLKPLKTYQFTSQEFHAETRTNRYGLRGPDPVIPKPPGTFRILMLGDSFTFGFPVRDEETFCALAQRFLREGGYHSVEVVNGGVSGYAPTLHYISLRDQYLTFEPDLVVLWLDLGDVQEDAWFQKNLVYDERGNIVRCDPYYINGRYAWWLRVQEHSALCSYIQAKLLNTLAKTRILGVGGYLQVWLRGERAKVAIARLKRQQQAPDLASADRFLLVREDATRELVAPAWALSARYLSMIRDLLASRGIPLVIGVYPYGMVAGPDQWAEGRTYWGFEPGRTYDASLALSLVSDFARDNALPLVSTYGAFREAARGAKLFYDGDGHMTPAGQSLVAETLVRDPGFVGLLQRRFAGRSLAALSRAAD